jgi:hypothetical protein
MAAQIRTADTGELRSGGARPRDEVFTLAEALDRILHKGVALEGEVTIGLAEVDLVYLDLRLLLASVDTIWPDGRSPLRPVMPTTSTDPGPPPPAPSPLASLDRVEIVAAAEPHPLVADPPFRRAPPTATGGIDGRTSADEVGSGAPTKKLSTAEGLVRLVLTVVKLLHDVLERQAVRRMTGGTLTDLQIENLGVALRAQAEELERLRRHFDFSDQDLDLNLGRLQGSA